MSEINAAGAAYAVEAEDDLYADMTDPATRATWTENGLRALIARLREMYGDEAIDRAYYARIESDATESDAAACVGGTTDCHECCEPQEITVRYAGQFRLACGHLVRTT